MIPKSYFEKFQTKKYSSLGALTGKPKKYFISEYVNSLIEIIEPLNPQKAIELGCGEGFVCGLLDSKFKNTYFSGVDIDQKQLELLEKNFPKIHVYNFDLNNILGSPVAKKNFDLVLCLETLEHLKNPEEFLLSLKKINYKDLIISVPWEPFFQISNFARGANLKNFGNDPEHINKWNKKQLSNLLSKNFTIKKHVTSFPWQIVWLK